jgi:hypothetical protein
VLTTAPDLVEVARRHATRMAERGVVFHNPALGDEVQAWDVVGENVGAGNDVGQLHAAFMASKVHRDEILFAGYREVGVGVAYAADGRLFVTQVFRQRQPEPFPAAPPPVVTTREPAVEPPAPASTTTLPRTVAPRPEPVLPTTTDAVHAPAAALGPEEVAEAVPAPAAVAAALLIAVVAAQGAAVRRLGLA